MSTGLLAFLATLAGVTIAEMGDKTQLLAMAFSTKYKPCKVFMGISIAIVILSSTAVAVGNFITRFEGIQVWIQAIAAMSFIVFGLLSLRKEDIEEEEEVKAGFRLGPVLTVAIAFFIAELGDKTQLATMAFAAKFPLNPIAVFFGGTFGLIIANAIGIGMGGIICRYVSERTIKIVSATVFILFGLIGSYQVAVDMLGFNAILVMFCLSAAAAALAFVAYRMASKLGNEICEVAIDKYKNQE